MYCQKCGNQNSNNSKFCQQCGQAINYIAPSEREYSGFWMRLGAYIIDSLVLLIPTIITSMLYRASIPDDNPFVDFVDFMLTLSIWWAYESVLHASAWQATIGKKLLGMRVVDKNNNRIQFSKSSGRFFAKFLSAILLGMGFIMTAFTKNKQSLHDKMAGTFVIRSPQT